MKVLLAAMGVVALLAVALILQAVFHSVVAGWLAFGLVTALALFRLIGWLPGIDLGDFDGDDGGG